MHFFLALLAATPSWSAALPVRLEALPAAPPSAFRAAAAPLSTSGAGTVLPPPLPTAPPLQPAVSVALNPDAAGISRIAAVGDAGTADVPQASIARAMASEHARAPFASVLVLGDNVYKNGEPEKFDAAVREPYAALFDGGARFYPVLGNHDVRAAGGEAQRAYWGAPRWYKASIGTVEAFALDTTLLIPHHQKHAYDDALPETAQLASEMLAWLDDELGKSTARHVVVYGHHPLYVSTNEAEKVAEAAELRALLEPILKKHGVKLYLSGHKHHFERSRPVDGVVHVISGAGGQLSENPVLYPSGVAETVIQKRHFLMIEAADDGLRVRALNKRGEILDEFIVR
jgi:3',5'-cyclic AMP phosphodiesterase CpdA